MEEGGGGDGVGGGGDGDDGVGGDGLGGDGEGGVGGGAANTFTKWSNLNSKGTSVRLAHACGSASKRSPC